jgi:hypothetical protein
LERFQVPAEKGLADPFDPLQAIPASARLLRELRLQFGNLGFVAAAYNAGPRRVAEWLENRGRLPRETRNYVVRVTGLSVDAWRTMPVNNNALTFVRPLPCRNLPAFANVEQEPLEQAQLQQAKLEQAKLEEPATKDTPTTADAPKHAAERKNGQRHAPLTIGTRPSAKQRTKNTRRRKQAIESRSRLFSSPARSACLVLFRARQCAATGPDS